jgi:hypothetical protein
MRPSKGETIKTPKRTKLEIDLDVEVIELMKKMEAYSKISMSEHVETALKRYITSHKDFLPESK